MKKNKIIVALALVLISFTTATNAHDGRFSIGAELALPMGDFADGSSMGFGGSLRYEHPVGDNLGITLTAGYLMFGGKDDGPDFSMIPAQVGAKYYFTGQQEGLYGHVMVGIHSMSSDDVIYTDPLTGATVTYETESNTELSYAPEIGYHLANIDLGLRYQFIATDIETTSYLGIRIAYVFGGN